MTLYMPVARLRQNDQAAAEARTSSLVSDVTRQYDEAMAPPEPSFALPSLESLGVTGALSPITQAIGSLPQVGQRASEMGQQAMQWALPSLESLGVSQPKPAPMPSAPPPSDVDFTIEDGRTREQPQFRPGESVGSTTVVDGRTAPRTGGVPSQEGVDTSTWRAGGAPRSEGAGEISNASRSEFVRTAWPHMLAAAGGNQDAAEMMLAAAISENGSIGSGRPFWANNFFGIKGKGDAGSVTADTHEIVNGQRVDMPDAFAAYSSPEAGFRAFFDFLRNNSRYAGALQRYEQTGDASQLFRDVNAAGYATDPAWASKVENIRRNQVAPITRGVAMNAGPEAPAAGPGSPAPSTSGAAQNVPRSPEMQPIPLDRPGEGGQLEPIPADQGSPLSGPDDPRIQRLSARRADTRMAMMPGAEPLDMPSDEPLDGGGDREGKRPKPDRLIVPLDQALTGASMPGSLRPGSRNAAVRGGPIDEERWPGYDPSLDPDTVYGNRNRPVKVWERPGETTPSRPDFLDDSGLTQPPVPPNENDVVVYRQPLSQQPEGAGTEPYDPRDADQGPHESVPPERPVNVPSMSRDVPPVSQATVEEEAGYQSQQRPQIQFSQGGPARADSQVVGPLPVAERQKPVWNAQGEVIGYRQDDEPPPDQSWRGKPLETGPAPPMSDQDYIVSQAVGQGPPILRDMGVAPMPPNPQSTRVPIEPRHANEPLAPYQDDQREPAPQPPGPIQQAVSNIGRSRFLNESPAQQGADIYDVIQTLPYDAYTVARRQLISDLEQRRLTGTDPIAPFRVMFPDVPWPSAEALNPDGRPAGDVLAGLILQGALPDPMDPAFNAGLRVTGATLGLGARGVRAADRALMAAGRGVRAVDDRIAEGVGRVARSLGDEAGRQVMDALPTPRMIESTGGGRPVQKTVEVIQEQIDHTRRVLADLDPNAEPELVQMVRDRVARLQSELVDARNARLDLEPRIRSEVGRRIEDAPTAADPRSADDAMRAAFPDERVRSAPDDLSGPVSVPVDTSSRLNAGFGVVPDESSRALAPRARAVSGDVLEPLADYDNPVVALADDIKWHKITIDKLREAESGGDRLYSPEYVREWLPVYQRELADMERRYAQATGAVDDLPVEAVPSRPTSPAPDRLGAVNRALGQGIASSVSGGVGAQVNAEMNPDDPNAAIKGFAVWALAPQLAVRGARRLARSAGKEAEGAGGALATFGAAPQNPLIPQLAGLAPIVQPKPPTGGITQFGAQQPRNARPSNRTPAITINGRVVRASSSKPPNLLEIAQSYRHSFGMLGQLGTGLMNAMGGPVSAGSGLATDVIRQGILKGYPVPAVAEAGSLVMGLGEAARDALGTALGFVPQRVRNAPDFRPPLAERMQSPIGQALGWVIDTPGRLATQTPDAFFGALFDRMGRRRAANELMMESGVSRLDPVAQIQEVQRLLNNPTPDEAARIEKMAREFSDELTYKGPEGYWEKALSGPFRAPGGPTTANSPVAHQIHDLVGSFLMPFYSSIFKIHKLAATYTPGIGMFADTSKPVSERIARQAVGLAFGIWVADRAAQGLVTGPGPDDPDEKAKLRANGWEEWSTYISGVGYVKSDNLAQAAPFLKTIGAYYDAQRYPSKKPTQGDDLEQGEAVVKQIMRAFEGFPVLRTVSDLYKAAQKPIEGSADMLIGAGSSLVPAIVRANESSKDPYQRTVDPQAPLAERIRERALNRVGSIPGVGSRQDSPPQLDRKGEPVPNPRFGRNPFLPVPAKERKEEDPITAEMGHYGVDLDKARDRWAFTRSASDGAPGSVRVFLKPEWQQEWAQARWQKIQEEASKLQANPKYGTANDGQKRKAWEDVLTAAENHADLVVKGKHRDEIREMIKTAPLADPLPQRRAS